MPDSNSKTFGPHFQICFAAFLLRDSDFCGRCIKELKPEYFTDEALQRLIRIIKAFFESYRSAPGILVLQELDQMLSQGLMSRDLHQRLTLVLDELFAVELQNRAYLLDHFEQFLRYQRIDATLPKIAEYADAGKFDEVDRLMREATAPILTAPQLGHYYTADPRARILRRTQEEGERCWTLIPELDQYVDGLRAGEVSLWQSQESSAGKTAALVLLARNFLFQRKRVLFFSLEPSIAELEDRLDMCLAGITKDDLLNGARIERQVSRYLQRGSLWLEKMPNRGATITDLRERARQISSQFNFQPDVVLIDYLGRLVSENMELRTNLFLNGEDVASSWRDWMQEDNIPSWSAIQSNRSAGEAKVARQQHAGGSIAIIQIAHVVITINRTAEETQQGRTTLFIEKNREGIRHIEVPINTDFSKMAFWTRGQTW